MRVRFRHIGFVLLAVVLGCSGEGRPRQTTTKPTGPAATAAANPATRPTPHRMVPWWSWKHRALKAAAEGSPADVVFLGDSITAFWMKQGRAAWEEHLAPLGAACHGIPADRTEHVLWRLRQGELAGRRPKVIVLLIGTNNLKSGPVRQRPERVVAGVAAVLNELQSREPGAKVLLLGVLPRQPKYEWMPAAVEKTNAGLRKLAVARRHVRYLELGHLLLTPEGQFSRELMGDLLHPTARGYEKLAEALEPEIRRMMEP
jgi:lysophospholipase L1-like esterase